MRCLLSKQQLLCNCFAQEIFYFENLEGFAKDQLMQTVESRVAAF